MSSLPADLEVVLSRAALVRSVDIVPRGHTRIETGFRYPDGTSIEVFLPVSRDTVSPLPQKLTDFGQTTLWLMNLHVKPWLSKKRRVFLEDAMANYGVKLEGGALETTFQKMDDLPSAIIRLGQACLRASDLVFTRRASLQSTFFEQFEEVLEDSELSYESSVEIETKLRKVKVDFLVQGRHTRSAVLTLASGNNSQAHTAANEVFTKFYDLQQDERPEQRVTVFDDSVEVFREADLERLKNLSDVVGISERSTVRELLAA